MSHESLGTTQFLPLSTKHRAAHVTPSYCLIRVSLLPRVSFSPFLFVFPPRSPLLAHSLTHFLVSSPPAHLQPASHRPSLLLLFLHAYKYVYIFIYRGTCTHTRARVRACLCLTTFFSLLVPSHLFLSLFRSLSRSPRTVSSLSTIFLPATH